MNQDIKVNVPQEDGTTKEMTIVFQEGCFDGLLADDEITQEEIDELIKDLIKAAESGELFQNAKPVTEEEWEQIQGQMKPRQ
jgi:hypothetical protein